MLKVINPATEQVVAKLPIDTPESIERKYTAAQKAQSLWAKRPLSERKMAIKRFGDLIERDADKLAGLLTAEMGKPLTQSRSEIASTSSRIAFFLERIDAVMAPVDVSQPQNPVKEFISHEPLGIIANISAWNYPYFVGTNVSLPALLTGNCVLYKPSEFAPCSGIEMAKLFYEAGVPEDVFPIVIGAAEEGETLLKQPIDAVFFTGSYATGVSISRFMAGRMVKLNMELGGKDPAYVCNDVNIKQAAEGLAEGAFYNAGQSCCAIERIYVHADIADAFIGHFVNTVKQYTVGDPKNPDTFIGPMTRLAQCEVLEKQVRDAIEKGAKVLLGGHRLHQTGYFFAPTVLVDVNHSMQVMMEESFGPIIGIQVVQNDDEACQLMQDTPYGLTASVYTPNRQRAENLLTKLQVGTAYINCCDRVSPYLPWSGRRHSGMGATLSDDGIKCFLHPKAWHIRG